MAKAGGARLVVVKWAPPQAVRTWVDALDYRGGRAIEGASLARSR